MAKFNLVCISACLLANLSIGVMLDGESGQAAPQTMSAAVFPQILAQQEEKEPTLSEEFTFSEQVDADLKEDLADSGNISSAYFSGKTPSIDELVFDDGVTTFDQDAEQETQDEEAESGNQHGCRRCRRCNCNKQECPCPHLCDVKICKPEETNCCVKTEFKDDLCVCGTSQETIADQSNSDVTAINSCGLDCATQKSCGHGCVKKTFIIHGGISVKEFIDKDICDGTKTCADGRYYKKAETLNRTCSECNCDPITCECNGVTNGAEDASAAIKSCTSCKKNTETNLGDSATLTASKDVAVAPVTFDY